MECHTVTDSTNSKLLLYAHARYYSQQTILQGSYIKKTSCFHVITMIAFAQKLNLRVMFEKIVHFCIIHIEGKFKNFIWKLKTALRNLLFYRHLCLKRTTAGNIAYFSLRGLNNVKFLAKLYLTAQTLKYYYMLIQHSRN